MWPPKDADLELRHSSYLLNLMQMESQVKAKNSAAAFSLTTAVDWDLF